MLTVLVFLCRIYVDLPDAENRKKILRIFLAKENLYSDFQYDELANLTEGYSGSDLKVYIVKCNWVESRNYYLRHRYSWSCEGFCVCVVVGVCGECSHILLSSLWFLTWSNHTFLLLIIFSGYPFQLSSNTSHTASWLYLAEPLCCCSI